MAHPPSAAEARLLIELADALVRSEAVPDSLWVRLEAAWPREHLARLLDAAGADSALWAPRLQGRPGPAGRRRAPHAGPRATLAIACLGVFMPFLDATVVEIAFPGILGSFPGLGLDTLSWVLNAYVIAFAGLLVPAGWLADRIGRRRVFALGTVAFAAASAACALAPSAWALIAARAAQGATAALLVPASLGLVLAGQPPARRARAVALWTATAALAAGMGPALGGALIELSDWRLVFAINVPLGALTWLGARTLPEREAPRRDGRPDLLGALLVAFAVTALAFAITRTEAWGWAHPGVLAAALAALAAGAALARRCRRHPAPVIDPRLLRAPGVAWATGLGLVASIGYHAQGLANILFLMIVWGMEPLTAGLATTPAPFVTAIVAAATGPLVRRAGARAVLVTGSAFLIAAPIALAAAAGPEPAWLREYLPAAVATAIGLGLVVPLLGDLTVSHAPGEGYATASGVQLAVRGLGAALGFAIVATILAGALTPADLSSAWDTSWYFCAACYAIVLVGVIPLRYFPPEAASMIGRARSAASARQQRAVS